MHLSTCLPKAQKIFTAVIVNVVACMDIIDATRDTDPIAVYRSEFLMYEPDVMAAAVNPSMFITLRNGCVLLEEMHTYR